MLAGVIVLSKFEPGNIFEINCQLVKHSTLLPRGCQIHSGPFKFAVCYPLHISHIHFHYTLHYVLVRKAQHGRLFYCVLPRQTR
jgi:hypothetical protein